MSTLTVTGRLSGRRIKVAVQRIRTGWAADVEDRRLHAASRHEAFALGVAVARAS